MEKLLKQLAKDGGLGQVLDKLRDTGPVTFWLKEPGEKEKAKDHLTAVANTDALDRDQEVLLPKGAVFDHFMKNPVMLDIHNYRAPAVGKVLAVRATEEAMEFDFQFADTDEGRKYSYLYANGYQKAFSVGFFPHKWVNTYDEGTPDKLELELPDGGKQEVDLSKYDEKPRRVYNHWELLEISPVPVPSNPEALLRAKMWQLTQIEDPAQRSIKEQEVMEQVEEAVRVLREFDDTIEDATVRGTVAGHTTPVVEESWQGDAARVSLARWASSDGTGDKDKINWGKYSRGFTWFDSARVDQLSAYKLPHHVARDGQLIAIWSGVTAAMAALLGARGGVDIPDSDRRGVYNHLARHYRDHDREVPEFRDYSPDDLVAIEDDQWPAKEGQASEEEGEAKPPVAPDATEKVLERLDELEAGISIRMSLVQESFDGLKDAVIELAKLVKSEEEPPGEGEEEDGDGEEKVVIDEETAKALSSFVAEEEPGNEEE